MSALVVARYHTSRKRANRCRDGNLLLECYYCTKLTVSCCKKRRATRRCIVSLSLSLSPFFAPKVLGHALSELPAPAPAPTRSIPSVSSFPILNSFFTAPSYQLRRSTQIILIPSRIVTKISHESIIYYCIAFLCADIRRASWLTSARSPSPKGVTTPRTHS